HGVFDGIRLLIDLLEHVVLERALLGITRFPFDRLNGGLNRPLILIEDMPFFRCNYTDLLVAKMNDSFGVADQGSLMAGHEVFPVADTDYERAAQPSAHDGVGIALTDHRKPIGPLEEGQRLTHRFAEIAVEVPGDQVSDDLGIRVGEKLDAIRFELALEDGEVFDDAVVHDGDFVVAADVGMRVQVGGCTVCGPAGVAYAVTTGNGSIPKEPQELADAAGFLANVEFIACERGQAGAIVAAVFEPSQSFHEDRLSFSRTRIADDAAHGASSNP